MSYGLCFISKAHNYYYYYACQSYISGIKKFLLQIQTHDKEIKNFLLQIQTHVKETKNFLLQIETHVKEIRKIFVTNAKTSCISSDLASHTI